MYINNTFNNIYQKMHDYYCIHVFLLIEDIHYKLSNNLL